MRLRSKRKTNFAFEQPPTTIAETAEVDAKAPDHAPVPWRVEQLQALGPVTGPSHRTSVPIVRSSVKDTSPASPSASTLPPTQLSFVSEGLESWKGSDSL
jgi:hypothetical protein